MDNSKLKEGRIRFLRGNSNSIANTDRKLSVGQPLYNIDKNYLTVASTDLMAADSQPITVRYIKGWYDDAKKITSTLDGNYYYFGPNETTNSSHSSTVIKAKDSLEFYVNGTSGNDRFIVLTRNNEGDSIYVSKYLTLESSVKANANITTKTLNVDETAIINGTLTLKKSDEAQGTSNSSPALIIGNNTGKHLQFDTDEIQAKSTSNNYSTLYLNQSGGNIYFSNNTSGGMYLTQSNNLSPVSNKGLHLGTSSKRWNTLYADKTDITTSITTPKLNFNSDGTSYISNTQYTGNADTATSLNSLGSIAALTGNTKLSKNGISMIEAYGYEANYPAQYGNVLRMQGSKHTGGGELLIGWSATSGAIAPCYIRSRRDVDDANWSEWTEIVMSGTNFAQTIKGSKTFSNTATFSDNVTISKTLNVHTINLVT